MAHWANKLCPTLWPSKSVFQCIIWLCKYSCMNSIFALHGPVAGSDPVASQCSDWCDITQVGHLEMTPSLYPISACWNLIPPPTVGRIVCHGSCLSIIKHSFPLQIHVIKQCTCRLIYQEREHTNT